MHRVHVSAQLEASGKLPLGANLRVGGGGGGRGGGKVTRAFTKQETAQLLAAYVDHAGLTSPSDKATLVLDGPLTDALFPKKPVSEAALRSCGVSRAMEIHCALLLSYLRRRRRMLWVFGGLRRATLRSCGASKAMGIHCALVVSYL